MKEKQSKPAFPVDERYSNGQVKNEYKGISTRMYLAAKIAAVLSNTYNIHETKGLVKKAYEIADELIKQENE